MCHDNEVWCKISRGIDLSFQNWLEKFDEFWPEHLKVSKIFTLLCSLWAKYILCELEKYSRVIFHETEEGDKIWRGINLLFSNWHKEFVKFWKSWWLYVCVNHSLVSANSSLLSSRIENWLDSNEATKNKYTTFS